MVHTMHRYSVLLPTWNERESLPLVVYLVHKACTESGLDFEIVIIEDNSDDGSLQVAQKLQSVYGNDRVVIVARKGKLGLQSAYMDGLLKASGDFIFVLDANLTQQPQLIDRFVREQARTNSHIVLGTRFGADHAGVCGWSWTQRLHCCVENMLVGVLFGLDMTDATSNFRLYTRHALATILHGLEGKQIPSHVNVAILVQARAAHFMVAEVPITAMQRLYGSDDRRATVRGLAKLIAQVATLFWTIG
ncbi:dolichol-phosphate mannosyltransferase [Achlya hypogyna]|uniref:dolichyl-phosphate beta-D-mannosyltransferase n=1 Tax=Achlya hypogyna TaxID=1202772 RepID=A0A1V9Y5G5_ACHHY|nr:dolichol-phosphate mannosyltransferase [Achlya hypogyna]